MGSWLETRPISEKWQASGCNLGSSAGAFFGMVVGDLVNYKISKGHELNHLAASSFYQATKIETWPIHNQRPWQTSGKSAEREVPSNRCDDGTPR